MGEHRLPKPPCGFLFPLLEWASLRGPYALLDSSHPFASPISMSTWRRTLSNAIMGCLIILSVSYAGLGCSSLHKDAETLMEGEEYAEATKVYEKILKGNPNDAKALVGLKRSRTNWIDKALLDVRMLRLSQQAAPATDLLKKIIDREREWQFYPEGAVHFTQVEETKYAIRLISAQVDAWETRGHLLKARAYVEGYRQVFATPVLIKRFENINSQLTNTAKNQCDTYKTSSRPSLPYFITFAKRYCDSWGISFDAGFDLAKTRAAFLFKEIDVISKDVSGIPEALYPYGREKLGKEFESSAWYDKNGSSPLVIYLKAAFSHDHKKTLEKAVHSYTVQVPYTVMIPQMRQIPHTTYQQMCTAYRCTSTPFTTYTYETYMVPATRYRDDPRQFNYDRWRHVQALAFHADLLSLIQGMEVNASHTQTVRNTDTEHPHSVPDIGLSPDVLSLPNPLSWLEKQIDEAAQNWGQALINVWIKTYCRAPEMTVDEKTSAEYVFRCLRQRQDPAPPFAENWFKEKLGADYRTVELWIDRSDNGPIPPLDIQEKE